MAKKVVQIFQSILNEADKIERTLLNLGQMPSQEVTESVANLISTSLKSLEGAVIVLIKNTDLKTNNLNPEVLESIDYEETKRQLEKISVLARRIERELAVNRK
jgi:hypothetical protein